MACEEASLAEAMSSYLVFLKGRVMGRSRTPYILAATAEGMGLFDPYTAKPTNFWRFSEEGVTLTPGGDSEELVIAESRGKSTAVQRMMGMGGDSGTRWNLVCMERGQLLTEFLFLRDVALGQVPDPHVFMGTYCVATEGGQPQRKVQVMTCSSALKIASPDGEGIVELAYHQIRRIRKLGDVAGGFAVKHVVEWHVFSCDDRDELIKQLIESSLKVGVSYDFGCSIALSEIEGEVSSTEKLRLTAMQQWHVQRQPPPKTAVSTSSYRNASAESRVLSLTPTHIVECESTGGCRVLSARHLGGIAAILRSSSEPQRLGFVFDDRTQAWYDCPTRDQLVVAVCDAASSLNPSTNAAVPVYSPEGASERTLPHSLQPDVQQQVDSIYVKRLASLSESGVLPGADDWDIVNPMVVRAASEVRAHVSSPGGASGKEVEGAILAVCRQLKGRRVLDLGEDDSDMLTLLGSLSILAKCKAGSQCIASAMKRSVSGGTGDIAAGVMSLRAGLMSRSADILSASAVIVRGLITSDADGSIRSALLDPEVCESLAGAVKKRSREGAGSSSLLLYSVLNLFCDLVSSSSSPTSANQRGGASSDLVLLATEGPGDTVVRLLADNVMMTSLLGHASRPVSALASKLLTFIIDGSNQEFVGCMQVSAMREGTLLRHLHSALFAPDPDQKALSRFLCAIWMDGSGPSASLLARVLPPGVQGLFKPGGSTTSDADGIIQVAGAPASAAAAAAAATAPPTTSAAVGRVNAAAAAAGNGGGVGAQGAVGAGGSEIGAKGGSGEEERARRREAWVQFFTTLDRDHVGIGILWDATRRNELKAALDAELDILQRHRASMSGTAASLSVSLFSWNHEEFEVSYPSLAAHFCVDGVYLKAALAAGDQGATAMGNLVPDVALFFTKLYRMYLEASTDAACIVYLRSMAALLSQGRAEAVMAGLGGSFYGMQHLLKLLERTRCVGVRDAALLLIEPLISNHPGNASEFVRAGGAGLLVRLAATIHCERLGGDAMGQTSNLLEAGAGSYDDDGAKFRVWFRKGEPERGMLLSEVHPFATSHPEELWRVGRGGSWGRVSEVEQLRWTVGMTRGGGGEGGVGMSRVQLCLRCISLLRGLCKLFTSRDESGAPKIPTPRIKRALSAPDVLPHIVQLCLSGHVAVVESGMSLLLDVLDGGDGDVSKRLYLTGFFFFSLCYASDDLGCVAKVLRDTHCTQEWYRRDAHESEEGGSPSRSILSQLLPPSLVCFLSNHDPADFSGVFRGDSDTPEAIWNGRMRGHLAVSLRHHVSTFAYTLMENCHEVYEYAPLLAPIRYSELENELWCHSYFLRNLCDSSKYPEWKIRDPYALLKATIDSLRREDARIKDASAPGPSRIDACSELGIDPCEEFAEAKKAYRRLVLQLHPDKNPEGRARFERVQAAFEAIQSAEQSTNPEGGAAGDGGVGGGKNGSRNAVILLLKTQVILYRRHGEELAKYRYPSYPLLCSTITADLVKGGDADGEHTCAVAEALAITAAAAKGNAEELAESGGFEVVRALLRRCVSVAGGGGAGPNDPWVRSLASCLHALSCILRTSQGLEPGDQEEVMRFVISCLSMKEGCVRETAIHACMSACEAGEGRAAPLVRVLCARGGIWALLDVAFGGGGVSGADDDDDDDDNVAEEAGGIEPPRVLRSSGESGEDRRLSTLSILALSLIMQRGEEDVSFGMAWSLSSILTPPLSILLSRVLSAPAGSDSAPEIDQGTAAAAWKGANAFRQVLCGSYRTVRFVWTESMRARAIAHVRSNAGGGVEVAGGFTHQELKGELWVGGVYIQPLLSGGVDVLDGGERENVCYSLLCYLNRVACKGSEDWRLSPISEEAGGDHVIWQSLRQPEIEKGWLRGRVSDDYCDAPLPGAVRGGSKADVTLATRAVTVLIESEAGPSACAMQALAALPLISRLMTSFEGGPNVESAPLALLKALCMGHAAEAGRVIGGCRGAAECLFGAIAARGGAAEGVIECLGLLCVVEGSVVGEVRRVGGISAAMAMLGGGWPEGTGELCGAAAGLLQVCLKDVMHGAAVLEQIKRALPASMAWKLSEEGIAALPALEQDHKTPELIWNESSRRTFKEAMRLSASSMCKGDTGGGVGFLPGGGWCGGEAPQVDYSNGSDGDYIVGGVYAELYITDPGFNLRDPSFFLEELFRCFICTALRQGPPARSDPCTSGVGTFWENGTVDSVRLLEATTSAALSLMRVRPVLATHFGSAGHIKGVAGVLMEAGGWGEEAGVESKCLQLLRQSISTPDNAAPAASANLIKTLLSHIKARPPETLTAALEVLCTCCSISDMLRRQCVDLGGVSDLLLVLSAGASLAHCVDASAARVHAIDTLKSLAADSDKGSAVSMMLEGNEAWRGCEGQKHDLFLSGPSAAPLLLSNQTSSSPSVTGEGGDQYSGL